MIGCMRFTNTPSPDALYGKWKIISTELGYITYQEFIFSDPNKVELRQYQNAVSETDLSDDNLELKAVFTGTYSVSQSNRISFSWDRSGYLDKEFISMLGNRIQMNSGVYEKVLTDTTLDE